MTKIKIYTSPTCVHCRQLKDWLKENKLEFTEYNVNLDEEARDYIIKHSGQLGVPVILIDKEMVIGFDQTRLTKLLNI